MKLVIAIVDTSDKGSLINILTKNNFTATKLPSVGGFLKKSSTTILIGVETEKVPEVIRLIEETCNTRTQPSISTYMEPSMGITPTIPIYEKIGGAVVFVVDVEQFKKI